MAYGMVWGGAISDRADFGSPALFDNLATGTVVVWEYPTTLTADRVIVSKYRGASQEGWFFANGPTAAALKTYHERATTDTEYVSTNTRSVDTWSFSAASWDTGASPVNHLYLGALASAAAEVSYGTSTDGSGSFNSDAARSLFVGNRDAASPNAAYQGTIAIVQMYNRVLSSAEIESLRLRPLMRLSGNILTVLFGDGGSTNAVDISGNGNNGTVTGATASGAQQLPLALHGRLTTSGTGVGRSLIRGGLVR